MANKMDPNKRRISYAEWKDVYEAIEAIAERKRCTPTEIFREATVDFVNRNAKLLDSPGMYEVVDRIKKKGSGKTPSKK